MSCNEKHYIGQEKELRVIITNRQTEARVTPDDLRLRLRTETSPGNYSGVTEALLADMTVNSVGDVSYFYTPTLAGELHWKWDSPDDSVAIGADVGSVTIETDVFDG